MTSAEVTDAVRCVVVPRKPSTTGSSLPSWPRRRSDLRSRQRHRSSTPRAAHSRSPPTSNMGPSITGSVAAGMGTHTSPRRTGVPDKPWEATIRRGAPSVRCAKDVPCPRPSRSTRANAWSRNSRCDGAHAVRTPDPHPGYSTTTLADDYRRWYPGFTHTDGRTRRVASHGLSRSPSWEGPAGEVGPRRGCGLSTGPFPRAASRTRRACWPGTGLSTGPAGFV